MRLARLFPTVNRRPLVARAGRAVMEGLEPRRLMSALTIAQENQLPGAPRRVWDIRGEGDPTLQGFAADLSVNVGSTVNFKIDDVAQAPYRMDIYRMGFYQGDGARLVTSLSDTQTLAVSQPAPVVDPSTGAADCGNWSVTAHWDVPADATSGVYFAKVIRDDTGGASHIVFVVRNDAGHAKILFQTSDQTWQAYNTYGGASLYRGDGPGAAPAAGRAFAVSYNRPFDNRATPGNQGETDWLFYAEYPMVRFLERNGYDTSYQTGLDTARLGAANIEQHNVFMSVGHDEYWSAKQRKNVTEARDHGVSLAFMSGNESFWKVRYGTNPDGTADYSQMICYKESLAGAKIDPSPIWTGLWRDGRFSPPADGGLPENALTGTLPYVNRGPNNNGTPITVTRFEGRARFWRNTRMARLAPGTSASVGDSVLGYEFDVDLDNGARPAGEIDLSSTTQKVSQLLQDLNTNVGPGMATHSLTLYRAASGALVFGAGTVQWAWGLDRHHDGKNSNGAVPPPDRAIRQATVNLLADMNVQPATRMESLASASASTDHTPPASAINVPLFNTVVLRGDTARITGTSADAGGGRVAGIEVSVDGGASWHPASGRRFWSYSWRPAAPGIITALVRGTDDSANTESPPPGLSLAIVGAAPFFHTATHAVNLVTTASSSAHPSFAGFSDVPVTQNQLLHQDVESVLQD